MSKIERTVFEIIERECQLFVYKKCPRNKIFFVFDPILTKIDEIVVLMSTIKKSRTFVPFRLNVEE